MKIPFVDLATQYNSIKNEVDNAIKRVISNSSYIGGEEVSTFENNFKDWLGTDYFVSCGNGTDSIEILLKALGIGIGDEVIVPAMSWISTSEAVSTIGATPIFVDIHPEFYTIDESLIENAITIRTKAIIPVHLYGQPCDMSAIMQIAQKYGLKVIEDCAQAHGTKWNGKRVGTFGDCASFSFFPGKNLGAYGDAGGMATNDAEIAKTIRMIANHGQIKKHEHLIEGRNSRLDGLQAAILNVKLKHLDNWIEKRIEHAKHYTELLGENIITPKIRKNGTHSFHLYVIQVQYRDEMKVRLQENNIECAIHYPTPLPLLPCYRNNLIEIKQYQISYEISNSILSIPIYPELEKEKLTKISKLINAIKVD